MDTECRQGPCFKKSIIVNNINKRNIDRLERAPIDICQVTHDNNNVFQSRCFRLLPALEDTVSQTNRGKSLPNASVKSQNQALDIGYMNIIHDNVSDSRHGSTKPTTVASNKIERVHHGENKLINSLKSLQHERISPLVASASWQTTKKENCKEKFEPDCLADACCIHDDKIHEKRNNINNIIQLPNDKSMLKSLGENDTRDKCRKELNTVFPYHSRGDTNADVRFSVQIDHNANTRIEKDNSDRDLICEWFGKQQGKHHLQSNDSGKNVIPGHTAKGLQKVNQKVSNKTNLGRLDKRSAGDGLTMLPKLHSHNSTADEAGKLSEVFIHGCRHNRLREENKQPKRKAFSKTGKRITDKNMASNKGTITNLYSSLPDNIYSNSFNNPKQVTKVDENQCNVQACDYETKSRYEEGFGLPHSDIPDLGHNINQQDLVAKEDSLLNHVLSIGNLDTASCSSTHCSKVESEYCDSVDKLSFVEKAHANRDQSRIHKEIVDCHKSLLSESSEYTDEVISNKLIENSDLSNTDETFSEHGSIVKNAYLGNEIDNVFPPTCKTKHLIDSIDQSYFEKDFQIKSRRNVISNSSANLQLENQTFRTRGLPDTKDTRPALSDSILPLGSLGVYIMINTNAIRQENLSKKGNCEFKKWRLQSGAKWKQNRFGPSRIQSAHNVTANLAASCPEHQVSDHKLSTSSQLNQAMAEVRLAERRASYRQQTSTSFTNRRLGCEFLPTSRPNQNCR